LNYGFVRERGIERTSTSRSTDTCRSKATNSAIVRVEWPIVKIVDIVSDCRTGFLRPFTSSHQSYERENKEYDSDNQVQKVREHVTNNVLN